MGAAVGIAKSAATATLDIIASTVAEAAKRNMTAAYSGAPESMA
jgi:hypothetical protein